MGLQVDFGKFPLPQRIVLSPVKSPLLFSLGHRKIEFNQYGLAGILEAAGPFGQMVPAFPTGYGFTAIIIAWLAKLNPIAIIFVSYLFGGLLVGADEIQPAGIAQLLQGVILFVVVGGEMMLRYRVRVVRE